MRCEGVELVKTYSSATNITRIVAVANNLLARAVMVPYIGTSTLFVPTRVLIDISNPKMRASL